MAGFDANTPASTYICEQLGVQQCGLRALKSCFLWMERSSSTCHATGPGFPWCMLVIGLWKCWLALLLLSLPY